MNSRVGLGPWGMVPVELLLDKRVTLRMFKVYVALASFQGNEAMCWPSVEAIAERSGVAVNKVSDVTRELEKAGWIEKVRRAGKNRETNVYRVLVPVTPGAGESDGDPTPPFWGDATPPVWGDRSAIYEKTIEKNKGKSVRSEELRKVVRNATSRTIADILVDEEIDPKQPIELDRHVSMTMLGYSRLCAEFGKDRVNSTIQSMSDWQRAKKGKAVYKDYVAAVRDWIKRDGGEPRRRYACPNCGVDSLDGGHCYYCGYDDKGSGFNSDGTTFLM